MTAASDQPQRDAASDQPSDRSRAGDVHGESVVADQTYGRVAARGMLFMSMVGVLSKVVGFGTNLVLGWLLLPRDFGLYGITVSLAAIVLVLADGGTARLLRHPDDFRRLGRAVAALSLLFNLFAACALLAAALPLGRAYAEPMLPWMLVIVAAALPLGNRPMVLRAGLGADLRFRDVSQVSAIATIVRGASMIGFAMSGLGPLSFVLPMLVVNATEWLVLRRLAPGPIPGASLDRETFSEIFGATRWIILGMVAAAIINSGAPAAIRIFQDTDTVGIFFFGLTVAIAPSVLFSAGMRAVLMPSMARLRNEPPRQAAALVKAVGTLALVGAPIAFGAALVAPPLTRFLYQGRWDAAIPVIVILGLSLAFRLSGPIGGSLLEARGEWRLRAMMLWIDAILTLAAAAFGAWLGSVTTIAIAFSSQRVLMGVIHCIVAGRRVALPSWRLLAALIPPHVVAAAAAGATWLLAQRFVLGWHDLAQAAFVAGVYGILVIVGSLVSFRHQVRAAVELVIGRRTRRAMPVDEAHEPPTPDGA